MTLHKQMTNLSNGALTAVMLALAAAALAEPSLDQLLAAAETSQAAAKAMNAQLLAPQNYLNGTDELDRARRELHAQQSADRVKDRLIRADNFFDKAIAAVNTARNIFIEALTQRKLAEIAMAPELASDAWAKTEKDLVKAARALEKGNEMSALEVAAQAAVGYSEAELEAIKATVSGEARRLISRAEQLRATKYTPLTINRARGFLVKAEQKLDDNRYAIEQPQKLVQQSIDATRLALFFIESVRQVQDKRLSLEEILINWQKRLQQIASAAEMQNYAPNIPDKTTERIVSSIEQLRSNEIILGEDLSNAQQYIASLEEEIRVLDKRLGGTMAARDAAVLRLEAQARAQEQYDQIKNLFDDNQALVLVESNTIFLHLVGLQFAEGSAALDTSNELLLDKLTRSIGIFSGCDIVIEGHTDSTGSDSMNLRLSQARADAVMNFLIAEKNIPGYRIKAVGYGDSRPIANNENKEGRDKNRRINILIIPKNTKSTS